jgi:cation diffusion facilitator family transporter
MHTDSLDPWLHPHAFLGANHARNERRTWIVIGLTAVMMVGEIIAGLVFGSMALLADGFHMATHAGALTIAAFAYAYARRHAHDPRFSFGTGKLGELAGYSSAVILAVVAVMIAFESVIRLTAPVSIRFDEAIVVAVLGLLVNLASAWILHEGGHHDDHEHENEHEHEANHGDHSHSHSHSHSHGHQDHNLRSAYFHVLTDALTSVLAIVALLAGRFYGWWWMDPLMGIVGGIVIAHWSWGLMRGAGAVLLDRVPDGHLAERIRHALEEGDDRVTDLHLWRVGPGHLAVVASLVADQPREPDHYKARLAGWPQLSHITIEVQRCPHGSQAI